MPYAPGVQDISGQLLGQGITNRAQGIAGGIGAMLQGYAKQNEENKAFQSKVKALETLITTHSDQFGLTDPEALKAFLGTDPNETLKNKYARLGDFVEGTITSKKLESMKQEDEARKASAGLAAAQAAKINYEIQQQKDEEKAFADYLARGSQITQAPDAVKPPMDSNLGELIGNVAGPQAVPQGVGQFMGAPQRGPVPAGVPVAAPTAAQAAPVGGDWLSAPTPPTIRDAAIDLRKSPVGKGGPLVQSRQREMAKEWESAQKKTRDYGSFEDAAAAAREMANSGQIPAGSIPVPKRDANGRYYLEGQVGVNPEKEAANRGAIKQSELLNEAAVKENEADITAGQTAQKDIAESAALRDALSDPNLYTGTGAEYVNKLKKVAKALGSDVKGIDSYDKLNALAGEQVLSRVALLRPASDQDIKLLQEYGKTPNKTKEGNLALIGFTERAAAYRVAKADFIDKLREEGVDESKIRIEKRKWERANPLTLNEDEQHAIKLAIAGTPSNSPLVAAPKSKRLSDMGKAVVADPAVEDPVAEMFKQLTKGGKK